MKKHSRKLLKKRCVFCGNSGSRLLYCPDEDRWTHAACLIYAVSETGFFGMEEVAGRMAYLLIQRRKK